MKKLLALLLVLVVSVGVFTACGGKEEGTGYYTYRTYTIVMPTNWNELTYADNNDTQILDYLGSPFFEYDYEFEGGEKYTRSGAVNANAIVTGGYKVDYSAATALEDVTKTVDAKWGYTDKQKAAGGYAWKITLRNDLVWEDGTPIDANDFVYTMQQQLNPLFQNMRASTYYQNIQIHNSRNYLYQGQTVFTSAKSKYKTWDEAKVDPTITFDVMTDNTTVNAFLASSDYASYKKEDTGWAWLISALWGGAAEEEIFSLQGKTYADIAADEALNEIWGRVLGSWQTEPDEELDFFGYDHDYPELDFADVGIYAPSKYELVVCLDAPIACLKEDGSLSYKAAYNFASLPLVHKATYEASIKEPQEKGGLYTTTYNSASGKTMSWGPYKLTYYQTDKAYTLERNDAWYGYGLEQNKNQYKINRINCEKLAEVSTQWSMFLSGQLDSIGLDVTHKDDYRNSKYTQYTPGTGTYSLNLYANLEVLKQAGRNSGILAIQDFRKAISLYLDRDDYNATTSTAHRSCYGILGPSYYYDVENGGVYRDTQIAKEGLLRVYGFTEIGDGTWTDGTNTYDDYQEAYDAMNGMNRTLAKELVNKAYKELTENAKTYGYDANSKIKFVYGTSVDIEGTRRDYNYIVKLFDDLLKDTPLEGKIEIAFDASFGAAWAEDFRAGAYEIASGTGFGGGPFDPAGVLQCYVDPEADLMYSTWWHTEAEELTYTMPAGDYEGAGEELTMSVYNWYCCLNGIAESRMQPYTYNWGAGFVSEDVRLMILSKIEEIVIGKYFSIPTTSEYSATVSSAKFANISDDYNVFLGYGGIRYRQPKYDDAEWAKYVSSQGNDLTTEYKKSE